MRGLERPLSAPGGARLAALAGAALALALGAGLGAVTSAAAAPPNPPSIIPLPASGTPAACSTAPTGLACEQAGLAALNAARQTMGLGPYALPAGFFSLAPTEQLLVLVDLDRIAYHEQPLVALNATVDAAAELGLQAGRDPSYPAGLPPGSWGANYAAGFQNVLYAYDFWMYRDGYGGGNYDCPTATSAGCWVHRRNILSLPSSTTAVLGAAVGKNGAGIDAYALEIVDTGKSLPAEYSWAQAVAAGAGKGASGSSSPPSTTTSTRTSTTSTTSTRPARGGGTSTTQPAVTSGPPAAKVDLTVQVVGGGSVVRSPAGIRQGRVTRAGPTVTATTLSYRSGSRLRLTARAKRGWRFAHWSGSCTGGKPVCSLQLTGTEAVAATFAQRGG